MGKALIITEKPSVSRDIVEALGGFEEKEKGEYWESDQYLCTYAVGHLLGLVEPEEIDPSWRRWSLNNLPMIPEKFALKPKSGQEKRIKWIAKLCKRKDVDRLVNACDAAREGELIFRELYQHLEVQKPFERLWLQSMTKSAIVEGFGQLRSGDSVEGLGAAAECRSRADWLIGMNATRALSVRLKTRSQKGAWSAGRVQTPTLSLLVERELEIENHISRPYWRIKGEFAVSGQNYEGLWYRKNFKKDENDPDARNDRIFDYKAVEELVKKLSEAKGLASETRKPRKAKAPGLFNLTGLQKAMSSRYGFSAKRTLQAAQRCYESHKILTYPRTNSSCLPEDYKPEVDRICESLKGISAYKPHAQTLIEAGRENEAIVFDNKGVSDHFAIIPTGEKPPPGIKPDDEKVFDMVTRRFLAAFYPPAIYEKVERTTIVDGEYFRTGPVETLTTPGWVGVYEKQKEEKSAAIDLAPLVKGQKEAKDIEATVKTVKNDEEATKPPARIGEARLLSLMENAGKQLEDDELAHALVSAEGLGTAATRADIIENLKVKEYVDANLRPSPKGIRLIDSLKRMGSNRLTSAELTGQLELHLNEVEEGKRTPEQFIEEVASYVAEIVERAKAFDYDEMYPETDSLGTCPLCKEKGEVFEKAWFYSCTCQKDKGSQSGGLIIWKDCYGRYLGRQVAKTLITDGETGELDGFRNANGQTYKAKLKLEYGKVTIQPTSAAQDTDAVQYEVNPEPLGPCPFIKDCPHHEKDSESGIVVETPTTFVCNLRQKDADDGDTHPKGFVLPRTVCKREMTREDAVAYLGTGETGVFGDFVSRKGRKFRAKLKMKPDGKHEFKFPPREPRKKKSELEAEAKEAETATDTDSAKSTDAVEKKVSAKKKSTTKKKTSSVKKKKTTSKKKSVSKKQADD